MTSQAVEKYYAGELNVCAHKRGFTIIAYRIPPYSERVVMGCDTSSTVAEEQFGDISVFEKYHLENGYSIHTETSPRRFHQFIAARLES